MSIENDIVYSYFLAEPYKKLKVKDKEYECEVGTKTEGGSYKNGYIAKSVIGKKEKYAYMIVKFYTSVNKEIDIEEQLIIRNDGEICKRLGWNNVNLLRFERPSESYNEYKDYVIRLAKELEVNNEDDERCVDCAKKFKWITGVSYSGRGPNAEHCGSCEYEKWDGFNKWFNQGKYDDGKPLHNDYPSW